MDPVKIKNWIMNYLFPRYDELTLFLYSAVMVLFVVFNRDFLFNTLIESIPVSSAVDLVKSFIVIALVIYLMVLPVYHAFSKRKKRVWEKGLMLLVIIIMNFIIAWNAYDFLKDKSTRWEMLFPLINAIQATLVILGLRANAVTTRNIADENAAVGEVALSAVLVVAVFILYHFVLHGYWAVTFSVCIFYATMINRLIMNGIKTLKIT